MRKIGPHSRPKSLAKIDGRTREAALMRRTREALVAHVGNCPTATQRVMIDQAVQLTIRIAAMDRKYAETGEQTDFDSRTYLAWTGSLTRLMRTLGLEAAPPPKQSHAQWLAGLSQAPEEAA